MHYFSAKSSKTSHLNHKNSDVRAKFSEKWSPGGTPPSPSLASALGGGVLPYGKGTWECAARKGILFRTYHSLRCDLYGGGKNLKGKEIFSSPVEVAPQTRLRLTKDIPQEVGGF